MRLRACRILLMPGRSFSPAASYFFPTAERSNQETPPRRQRPLIAKSRSAIRGCPALLARGGVHRQAIPGLTMDASASMPRSARTDARAHAATNCDARRRQRGGESKAKATATAQSNIKSPPLPSSSYRRKPVSRGRSDVLARYRTGRNTAVSPQRSSTSAPQARGPSSRVRHTRTSCR